MCLKFDDMTPSQISLALEAKITNAIRTSKRTREFKIYLDILNAAYIQATALSEMLKTSERLAIEE